MSKKENPANPGVWRRLALCFGGGLALLGIVLALTRLPAGSFWSWLNYGESGSTTLRNLGLIVLGLIGLPFAMWRTIVAARQADIARHALQNERHQRAVEMFAHSVLVVRLGGIYALQHLANEHPTHYHIQVMRLFCAFLQYPPTLQTTEVVQENIGAPVCGSKDGSAPKIRRDVEDVVRAIGTRDKERIAIETRAKLDLVIYGADLRSLQLYDIQSFTYDLTSSELIDSRPHRRANLSRMHFRYVDFSGANLSFVDMAGATFWDPNLTNAVLESADLSETSWEGGTSGGARFNDVDFSRATMLNTSFADADLSSANLSDVLFQGVDLSKTNLRHANISAASFSFIKYKGALIPWKHRREFAGASDGPYEVYVGVRGLTQGQIDEAHADPKNPPQLEGVVDANTGEPLVWPGR